MSDKRAKTILALIKQKEERKAFVKSIIGSGYDEFWDCKDRYRVVKGGRGSKKSTTTALWFIENIMEYRQANAVVVRKTSNTHKDSTFAQLKWAATQLGVYDKWKFIENPMEATYIPTGQKILFRGFDDVLKLTSLTVQTGVLCWAWMEEAYEIDDEKSFDTFDEGIRGQMPTGLWKQITITYNPWVNKHWTKSRFWGPVCPKNTFRLTTTHKCNEFMDEADHQKIEDLAVTNPARYKVVGLGEYGMPGGAYFDEFRRDIHVIKPFPIPDHWHRYTTKDYGLDMLANYWIAIDTHGTEYVYKELHESGLIISEAVKRIKEVNGTDVIKIKYAPSDLNSRQKDSGKSQFDLFREHGESCIEASRNRIHGWLSMKEHLKPYETADVETGEKKISSKMLIFDNCVNLIDCLEQAVQDESDPNDVSDKDHSITHALDAIRYYCVMRQRPTPDVKTEKRDTFLLGPEPENPYECSVSDSFISYGM